MIGYFGLATVTKEATSVAASILALVRVRVTASGAIATTTTTGIVDAVRRTLVAAVATRGHWYLAAHR
jgi:hypothetical protein